MSVRWDDATKRLGIPHVGIRGDKLEIMLADDCDIVIERGRYPGAYVVKISCDGVKKTDIDFDDGDLSVVFRTD